MTKDRILKLAGVFQGLKNLQNSLLRILVLDGRTLGTFVPRDHVLH